MDRHHPTLEQSGQSFLNELLKENRQLKQQLQFLHEQLQILAMRYNELLDLNIQTALYAKTQSPEHLAKISVMLQMMIPPPPYRRKSTDPIDDDDLNLYDLSEMDEETAQLAAELFPDEPYFQTHAQS